MSGDWGPVVVAVVLFVLCSPGLLFQLPGNKRAVEFANFQTSPISIFVHTIIFFGLVTIFVIAIGIHIYSGSNNKLSPLLPFPCCLFHFNTFIEGFLLFLRS
ncbi:hypothetical protein ES319_A05G355400v1 [Gossypium barbadense]|uniref:Transmembrane protein n=1 Tax=Gossypium barbadense TaxID=3634 RepID=A0A5J5VX34_GOSBA|nr:hypothetical protein ES319_A05G355400v1 [Gossypium barbadense]